MPDAPLGTKPKESIWVLYSSANCMLCCICVSGFASGEAKSRELGLGVGRYRYYLQPHYECSSHTRNLDGRERRYNRSCPVVNRCLETKT